jgi:hypothetical protein
MHSSDGRASRTVGFSRRGLLHVLATLPVALATACAWRPGTPTGSTLPRRRIIDAHCHTFNITDLPAATFVHQALLGLTPGSAPADALLKLLLKIQRRLSTGVLKAADEAKGALLTDAPGPLSSEDEKQLDRDIQAAEQALAAARAQSLFECPKGPSPSPNIRSISSWFKSFRSSRRSQVRTLTIALVDAGYQPELLCPALVDYSLWLGQGLDSPLPDQVDAMAAVSANPDLPAVHGYVAFDPLRRAMIRSGKDTIDGSWDPLDLTRTALREKGFVGVKVYPPMGFQASGNAASGNSYPQHVRKAFGSDAAVGAGLDRSLDELWQLCLDEDAPVMAHAAASNGSRRGYGARADPTYWFRVAQNHPNLRILLAHFGRYRDQAAEFGPPTECPDDTLPFDRTWDAAVGRFIKANPACHLFVDLSYLSDLFHTRWRRHALEGFRQYLSSDPDGSHVVFGTDWVMLGIEKAWHSRPRYPQRVAQFLAEAGLKTGAIDGILYGNALRFLGLTSGSRALARLETFQKMQVVNPKRLPAI